MDAREQAFLSQMEALILRYLEETEDADIVMRGVGVSAAQFLAGYMHAHQLFPEQVGVVLDVFCDQLRTETLSLLQHYDVQDDREP